jgi:hypothetical protein
MESFVFGLDANHILLAGFDEPIQEQETVSQSPEGSSYLFNPAISPLNKINTLYLIKR